MTRLYYSCDVRSQQVGTNSQSHRGDKQESADPEAEHEIVQHYYREASQCSILASQVSTQSG